MLAIVVLNVRELMHIFRRVWQDFGPFPLIGCDSEGLVWHFDYEKQGDLLRGIDKTVRRLQFYLHSYTKFLSRKTKWFEIAVFELNRTIFIV